MKRTTTFDKSKWDKGIETWKSILEYRKAKKNPSKSQLEYFNLYIKYLEKLQRTRDEGGFIVAHATSVPAEIFYALDLTPVLLVGTCFAIAQCLKEHATIMQAAKDWHLSIDSCSAHRNIIGQALLGWLPKPDVFVDIAAACDAFANSMKVAADIYDVPHYTVDVLYYSDKKSIDYLSNQFGELIRFLEKESGRKMNWEKLEKSLHHSKRMIELWREVWELRKAAPTPMDNRRAWETNWINWFFYGTHEGVHYWEVLRDELKERVDKGVSAFPDVKEKLRILDLFMAPAIDLTILEWMQKEWGANIVAEMLIMIDLDFELKPEKMLHGLAEKWYAGPAFSQFNGPTSDYCENVVKVAKDFKVDAALWWDHNACRQAGAISMVKDALDKELGIPMVQVDTDITDPAFVANSEMRDKLSMFFEILETRKGN